MTRSHDAHVLGVMPLGDFEGKALGLSGRASGGKKERTKFGC
jgi:hypothetical protein